MVGYRRQAVHTEVGKNGLVGCHDVVYVFHD